MRGVERPRPIGVDHLGLSVTDLMKSTAFYCEILGGDVLFGPHDADSYRGTVIKVGSHLIDINHISGNDRGGFDAARTGLDHLAFTAASREALDDWARLLDANNVARSAIRSIPGPIDGAMFDFVGPDGIQLEFVFVNSEILPRVVLEEG